MRHPRTQIAPFPTEADFEDELEHPSRRRVVPAHSAPIKADRAAAVPMPSEAGPGGREDEEADFEDELEHPDRRRRPRTLREMAAEKVHGPGANPTMLGDPISSKAETSQRPRLAEQEEAGNCRRGSKL